MANRDLAAFASFVDDEAVFFAEGGPLRGKGAIVEGWQGYFETDEAPFSWEPGTVEVLPSGKLALSTGPVYDRGGACVATFTSIWRLADDNMWRVVFDRGSNQCEFAD